MQRFHREIALMRKRVEIARRDEWFGSTRQELGRYRKRHPFDCGRRQCLVCHYGKWQGELPMRDLRKTAESHDESVRLFRGHWKYI